MSRRTSDTGVEVELPVTPMLDMTFKLLFFFIVTFNPPALESQFDFPFPRSEGSRGAPEGEPRPPGQEIELPSDLTVEIKAHEGGEIRLIVRDTAVAGHEIPDPLPLVDGRRPTTKAELLTQYLKQKRKDLTNQNEIRIVADARIPYDWVVEVVDACIKAGFRRVSFGPPPTQ